jgi:hypothetical protein
MNITANPVSHIRLFCIGVLFSFALLVNNFDVNSQEAVAQNITESLESLKSFVGSSPSSPSSETTPTESLESLKSFVGSSPSSPLSDFEEESSISSNTRDNQGGSIYWAGICSKLDFFIIESCENLVTNNGYDLTDKGKQVAACIAGGGLLTFLDPSMQTLLAAQPLGKAAGCSTLLSKMSGGGGIGGLLGALGGN